MYPRDRDDPLMKLKYFTCVKLRVWEVGGWSLSLIVVPAARKQSKNADSSLDRILHLSVTRHSLEHDAIWEWSRDTSPSGVSE